MKIPVIVDEMNVMYHLRKLNIYHISWTSFYSALRHITGTKITPYFACANVGNKGEFHEKRNSFFRSLERRGINILEGFSVRGHDNRRIEKGVDVLVALQIFKESLNEAKDIIVCSADSDLVPAIKEAQSLGARVHCVISDSSPSKELVNVADSIIRLETILEMMNERGHIQLTDDSKPFTTFIQKKNYANRRAILA